MTMVSVSAAARLVNKSRSNLYATYIKPGKLSVVKNAHTGKPEIDTAELLRVFGEFTGQSRTDSATNEKIQNRTEGKDSENSALSVEVKVLRELLAAKDGQIEEAREREAKLWRQVEELTSTVKLIENKSTKEAPRRGWLTRLFSS